jgi:hypothetical protein
MNDQRLIAIMRTTHMIQDSNELLCFLGLFIWLAGWYILYQMTRLKFLKLIIVGDILCVAASHFLFRLIQNVTGNPAFGTDQLAVTVFCTREVLSLGGTILTVTGAALGLRHLQRKWTQVENSRAPAAG